MILLWQILYSFYNYAEMIKREPGFFGTRAWSHYGSIYLRHFNELDHEYVTRLSRGYKGEERQLDQLVGAMIVNVMEGVTLVEICIC